MTYSTALRSAVCTAALIAGSAAHADLTAAQVWEDWKSQLEVYGSQNLSIGAEETSSGTVTVRDNGPGLPAKAIENIFKPFEGSVRKGGTGLGLAISAELVRGHSGKLELIENSDQGAAFQMWLPK